MKLTHSDIDRQFDFDENNVQFLIVENSKEYFRLSSTIHDECEQQCDGKWVLSDNSEILSLQKYSIVLHNYLEFSCNNKKVENLINNEVLQIVRSSDYYEEFSQLNTKLISLNDAVLSSIDLPISYCDEFTFEDFIKFSHYKIKEDINILDKIVTFCDIFVKLKRIKLVVFIGLTLILDAQEIEDLIKQLRYMDISILFIEPQDKYAIGGANKTIIDNDLCVI